MVASGALSLSFGCERPTAPVLARSPPVARGSASSTASAAVADAPPAVSLAKPATVHELASASPPVPVAFRDIGIYPELTAQVRIDVPARLRVGPMQVARLGADASAPAYEWVAGSAVAFAPPDAPAIALPAGAARDTDGDSIPDALDVLIGAKRAVAAAAPYRQTYRTLAYPGGDVPRDEGVCSDVIVRALRNAGYDLQALIHEDAIAAPRAYPGIRKLDPNIDQRRVRNLVAWFTRHWVSLPVDPSDTSTPWLPGDIVFLDTLSAPGPDHVSVVSDRENDQGRPLLINSWTDGYRTGEMDLLNTVPVTHRFRVPPLPSRSDIEAVVGRAGLEIGPEHRQLLLVTAPLWTSTRGRLRRFDRTGIGGWRLVGNPVTVELGDRGIARDKNEGDHRSPAGVFDLGTAFGKAARPPSSVTWPYRATDERDRWVDDASAPLYNTWQRAENGETPWRSAERLSMYELAIVVRYNDAPVRPGAGSAIFLHTVGTPPRPTVGCTSMPRRDLVDVLRWLSPAQKPVLVQVADALVD